MKNSKLKIGIINAAIAVGFFLVGSFVGWPNQSSLLSGDIGKAKKSNTTVVKIDRDALQEKMLNDTTYCQKMLATVGMMQLHAKQFGALLVMTDAVAKDEKALQSSLEEMQKVTETVKNATAAIDLFADDMVRLSKGDKVKSFEQDYNNAMLGFSMLQRCSNVALDFAQNVRDSLNLLAEANKKDLETIYSEWVTFAYADALMSQDQLRCRNIEQLFFYNNGDQLGVAVPFIVMNSGDQLGKDMLVIGNSGDQLGIKDITIKNSEELFESKFRSFNNEQLQMAGVQNVEQLKVMYLYGQQLNAVMIVVHNSNSDNNLGCAREVYNSENSLDITAKRFDNSTGLPCVEMLNFMYYTNQDNLQSMILYNDVLGAIYGSRGK